jgi:hypothetical protein
VSILRKISGAALCLCSAAIAVGQQALPDENASQFSRTDPSYLTRIFGPEDRDVPLPSSEGLGGRKDVSALQEIIDFLNTVKVSTWTGMRAQGVFTDFNDVGSIAEFTLGSTTQYRLDITTARGTRSTRIDRFAGSTRQEDGTRFNWSAASAAGGFVAYPRLFATTLGYTATAIVDLGFVTVGQARLHRIAILEPASADQSTAEHSVVTVADFYFDSTTHLLKMSSCALQIAPSDPQRYMMVMTYDDYRKVGPMLLPFKVSQTMNGQRQWSLQLTDVSLAPAADPSYFRF